MSKTYKINEIFYSLQGEGIRCGTPNIFVRFSNCNLECRQEAGPKSPGGFDCDTEFTSGRRLSLNEINDWLINITSDAQVHLTKEWKDKPWLILTGGEPGLQVDKEFCTYFHNKDFKLAIETNGSLLLPCETQMVIAEVLDVDRLPTLLESFYVDWITVSPKVAEHAIRQPVAHEVKYVRGYGQAIPNTKVQAYHKLISPAFDGLEPDMSAVNWCIDLVKRHPDWRLSPQVHKLWQVR